MQFHAYGVIQDRSGQHIVPQSEREVFERLGVPYREPAER
jgi:DNA polymerase/3'-5' exonuclease PolX